MASRYPKRAKYICYIDSVPDDILTKVFSYLPLAERLHLSEVCSRWHKITHLDWLDVTDLDLTPIPSPNIGAVLRLSPNVESVFALRRLLILNDLTEHYLTNLTSVKLFDVKMALASTTGDEKHTNDYRNIVMFMRGKNCFHSEHCFDHRESFLFHDLSEKHTRAMDLFTFKLNRFFEKLPQLEQLVLHNLGITDLQQLPVTSVIPFSLENHQLTSLTRLQLSGSGTREFYTAHLLTESLYKLQQLECLILHVSLVFERAHTGHDITVDREFFDAVSSLKNLRELNLATLFYSINEKGFPTQFWPSLPAVAFKLPKLEAFFLIDQCVEQQMFGELYTKHPTLRILMLAGSRIVYSQAFIVPTRKFQLSESSQPLPFLHVFLGHGAHQNLRYTETQSCKVSVFTERIDEFFDRPDVAPILDGVWVADMISETASYDRHLWRSTY